MNKHSIRKNARRVANVARSGWFTARWGCVIAGILSTVSASAQMLPCGDSCGDSAAAFAEEGCAGSSCDWLSNLEIFGGLEGSKQTQDFGVNANFGGRVSANLGIPLLSEYGLGAQMGTSLNATDNAVQVFERVGGPTDRQQVFTTVGLFQRSGGWTWGIAYDLLNQASYDDFTLSQWRGELGYSITSNDEIGIWGTIDSTSDSGNFGATPLTLSPINQGSAYWRHFWPSGAGTAFWIGVAEGHGEVNLALGDLNPVGERLVFGSDISMPLNDRLALYGEANFLTPADTGTVDAYLGIVWTPFRKARPRRTEFAPLLPVASNTRFAVDLSR